MNITSVKVDIRREKVDIGLATDLLNTCYSSPEASLIFCVKESPVAVQTKSENIFEKLFRKFLSIGSPAGKCWNKTSLSCKKCADAPIIRREKWRTRKVDRTYDSFIQLRVFFSRIHKKSAYRHTDIRQPIWRIRSTSVVSHGGHATTKQRNTAYRGCLTQLR